MYQQPFVYPHVERGYEVEFAQTEDTPDANWELGKVTRTKNGAVDIKLLAPVSNSDRKFDVRHIGDPSIARRPLRGDSGVFRLARSQLQINEVLSCQQALMRRMEALEQTFRAVMDTLRSESDSQAAPIPSPSRRQGRNQTASV